MVHPQTFPAGWQWIRRTSSSSGGIQRLRKRLSGKILEHPYVAAQAEVIGQGLKSSGCQGMGGAPRDEEKESEQLRDLVTYLLVKNVSNQFTMYTCIEHIQMSTSHYQRQHFRTFSDLTSLHMPTHLPTTCLWIDRQVDKQLQQVYKAYGSIHDYK